MAVAKRYEGDDERCLTCGEAYSQDPTDRATFCSDSFHMCRSCKWRDGKLVARCNFHHVRFAR
jgi:hypothetical protein